MASKKSFKKVSSERKEDNLIEDITEYDVNNIIFSEPQLNTIPNQPSVKYYRIYLDTRNPNGTKGSVLIRTPQLFSFGVSENKSFNENEKGGGYTFPLCLWSREGATDEEKSWISSFNAIVDHCKKKVFELAEDVERYDLSENEFKTFNPLFYKKEKGKIVEGQGPTLYPKLIQTRNGKDNGKNKFYSNFFDKDTEQQLEPLELIGKHCQTTAIIKVESIFINSKSIKLQVKLFEAVVSIAQNTRKNFLVRQPVSMAVNMGQNSTQQVDGGSVENSDNEEETKQVVSAPTPPAPVPQPKVAVLKRPVAVKK